eukprot:31874-Eustigmatos_ZCMA.PRE.1
MADEENHINKNKFKVPFVCGCRDLGEALVSKDDASVALPTRRIAEGAAMLRTKGEAGTGNVVEAVRHARTVQREIKRLATMDEDELFVVAKQMRVSLLPVYGLLSQHIVSACFPWTCLHLDRLQHHRNTDV